MTPTTTLGFALLGLLQERPRSGYDLRKVFATTPMAHYSSSPGAIYPALRRLQRQGLISGSVDRSQSLRPKKTFRPTAKGIRALKGWLSRPVTREDVVFHLDELLLRFSLMAGLQSRAQTRRFLKSFARELEAYVAELQQQREALRADAPLHGRLALECGTESYRAHARWAKRALSRFSSKQKRQ
jgi:DNA-binding PadR family transcriptional regulator